MKKVLPFVLFIFFSVGIVSCKKEAVETQKRISGNGDLCFNLAMYSITGISLIDNISKYYCPQQIKKFSNHYMFVNGRFIRAIDFYYPEKIGLIDAVLFYIPETDRGEWIDGVINEVEERRIASAINDLLDDSINAPFDDTLPVNDALNSVQNVEKQLIDSENRLKAYEYGNEIFIPNNIKNDKREILSVLNNKVERKFYDEKWRIIKLEKWIINGAGDYKKNIEEDYEYNSDSFNPAKKIQKKEDNKSVVVYEGDKVIESVNYRIQNQKDYIQNKFQWTYSDDGKILTETSWDYYYKKGNLKRLDSVFKKSQKYFYNEKEDCPPDYQYYENDVLKLKTVYISKNEYQTSLYFDESLSVTGYYQNNIHTKDVFYKNGKRIRTETYE